MARTGRLRRERRRTGRPWSICREPVCDAAPVLEPAEHYLDPVAAFVVLDWLAAQLPIRGVWGDQICSSASKPPETGFIPLSSNTSLNRPASGPSVGQQPFGLWQAPEESRCPHGITDLARGHEEADRTYTARAQGAAPGRTEFRGLPCLCTRETDGLRSALRRGRFCSDGSPVSAVTVRALLCSRPERLPRTSAETRFRTGTPRRDRARPVRAVAGTSTTPGKRYRAFETGPGALRPGSVGALSRPRDEEGPMGPERGPVSPRRPRTRTDREGRSNHFFGLSVLVERRSAPDPPLAPAAHLGRRCPPLEAAPGARGRSLAARHTLCHRRP
jgi:hypothetical protein